MVYTHKFYASQMEDGWYILHVFASKESRNSYIKGHEKVNEAYSTAVLKSEFDVIVLHDGFRLDQLSQSMFSKLRSDVAKTLVFGEKRIRVYVTKPRMDEFLKSLVKQF